MKNDGRSIKNGGYNGGFSHETLSFKHEKYGEMVGYPGPSLKWWEMGMSPFNGLTMKNDGQPFFQFLGKFRGIHHPKWRLW